jgi:hypothetical protein
MRMCVCEKFLLLSFNLLLFFCSVLNTSSEEELKVKITTDDDDGF